MPKQELSIYEVVEQHLFKSREDASLVLTDKQLEVKQRLMLCVSKKLDEPMILDSEIVSFLVGGCGGATEPISQSQAYRDVAAITRLVGNVQLASKAWYRYMIVEGAKKGFAVAETKDDAKGMAANLDKIGKYTRADKEDDDFNWEEMIPPGFEPTDDITVLEGVEPIDNLEEERKNLRSIFKKEMIKQAEDVECQEVKKDDKKYNVQIVIGT